MISKPIMRLVFIISIFIFWTTQSVANDDMITKYSNYEDVCNDGMVSLNFSNTEISDIGPDFISSPLIVCLNLTNNNIKKIARNAFRKLPNLTNLFLSNNRLGYPGELFNFGSHEKLKVLIMNNATTYSAIKDSAEIFGKYPNLEILLARNNYLSNIRRSSYIFPKYLAHDSLFPKVKVLDLSGNIIRFPAFVSLFSNSLQFIDMHNNSITNLRLEEKGENLIILNLDNNKIVRVGYLSGDLTLAQFKNLQYFTIYANKIQVIDSTAFMDTKQLIYLNLSTNSIENLHPYTFENLQSLHTLDLSFNQLHDASLISNKTNLNILYLSCNKIEKIIANAFAQTPNLTKLLLGGNQIDQIDAEAFNRLSALEELDLSRNKLRFLPEGWTASFISLKYLDLSDNTFTLLESLSLLNALPLIELYLMMNPLQYLNIRYFESLPQNLTVNLVQRSNFSQSCKYN